MRKLSATILLALLLPISGVHAAQSPARARGSAEEEVRKLEREWLDAYEQRDVKAMHRIVADDFRITFADGSVQTKSQVVDSIKGPVAAGAPRLKFYTEDVVARVYGNAVILMGVVVTEYVQNEKVVKEPYRYTDTYVKREGRWQVVASHLSNAPRPKQQAAAVSSNSGQGRSAHGNKLISLERPTVRIEVDEQLPHAGILNFRLKEVAQVERYVYARADAGGRVERLLIVQFESILPGVKGSYSFPIRNATRLGKHEYDTSVGIFNFARTIAANPGAEAEHTRALLEGRGFKVDHDFVVARYARVVDDARRHEVIFFYLEDAAANGLKREDVESGSARAPAVDRALEQFVARALESFTVAD